MVTAKFQGHTLDTGAGAFELQRRVAAGGSCQRQQREQHPAKNRRRHGTRVHWERLTTPTSKADRPHPQRVDLRGHNFCPWRFRVVNQNNKKYLLTGRSEQDNGVSLAEDVEEGLDVENGEVEEDAEEERQGQGGQRPSVARRQHDEREEKANLKADEGGERRLDRACLLLFLFRDDSPSAADLPRRTA